MTGSTFIESKNNPKNNSNSKNLKASDCKAVPNGLTNLTKSIDNCTSEIEKQRNYNFATDTVKLEEDISSLRATTNDALIMGDTMFGQAGYSDIAKQVQERNNDLKNKKENLLKEIGKGEEIIARSNRDFADVHDTITEPQPQKTLRFIEDYTLAILTLSYLFMIIAAIYIYTVTSEFKLVEFYKLFVVSILL